MSKSYKTWFIYFAAVVTFLLHIGHTPLAYADGLDTNAQYIQNVDELHSLWSFYKHFYIQTGRVISPDEGQITTSEGQGYGLLRAVWSNDRATFQEIWTWTKGHLQTRPGDRLFSWKWKGKVLDVNAATDADTDIALALILASRKFDHPEYLEEAKAILNDIWRLEILNVGKRYFVTGGNWAPNEEFPTLHVAYFAPYAYEVFAQEDSAHPWKLLVDSSYEVLKWIYYTKNFRLPPTLVYIDKVSGEILLNRPKENPKEIFTYDAFPIFWRVALASKWYGHREHGLKEKMLSFFSDEWKVHGRFLDKYSLQGESLSKIEAPVLYATVHSLAQDLKASWGQELYNKKVAPFFNQAKKSQNTPYYLQNWLWFDRALDLEVTLHFDEFLGFLRPFQYERFETLFPWWLFGLGLLFYLLSTKWNPARFGFIAIGGILCCRYILWRVSQTLNFIEPMGPFVSIALWLAEAYCLSTVLLLIVQVGLKKKPNALPAKRNIHFAPSVDIFIPIYSEPLHILESTLWAAVNMEYPNKKVYVCDDSHQDSVKELTERLGAHYIRGPKKHAKAGNMNNALTHTQGELVVIFDTDHIPVKTFLKETVPYFEDSKIGFVQTPHHFYNEDIFQRAFGLQDRIPNEQDMFNHAIQSGRDSWGGSFFVGSGAVFRRVAVQEIGGFNTMSITEDIHTSQHLHSRGWTSAFVDKDLAVGLTAENLSSYLVQRRRWMLGCLQIFFKDNPLFMKGLSLRQRVGYFSSLYYFFFPPIRVIFILTPLLFLMFHWHPVFSEISELAAYLLPFLLFLPLLSSAILPGWPRMFWGTVYENVVAFALTRSIFDLLLPKNLGFKVTPKGLVTEERSFDFQSSEITLVVAALTLFAILKGSWEFYYFQIEKDAYFFNLAWAGYNLFSLLMALAVAWEQPQRRGDDRIRVALPFKLSSDSFSFEGNSSHVSLSGIGIVIPEQQSFPLSGELVFKERPELTLPVKLIYNERHTFKTHRVGFQFQSLSEEQRKALFLYLFTEPARWENIHNDRVRTNFGMGIEFFRAIASVLKGLPDIIPWKLRKSDDSKKGHE